MNSRLKIQLREKPNDENIYGMLNDSYKINTQILIFSSRSITIKCFKQAAQCFRLSFHDRRKAENLQTQIKKAAKVKNEYEHKVA